MLEKIDNCDPFHYKTFPGLFNIKYEKQSNGIITKTITSIINGNNKTESINEIGQNIEFPMGYVDKKKTLHAVLWCPSCKRYISRDVNAAMIIKRDKFMKKYFYYNKNKWSMI